MDPLFKSPREFLVWLYSVSHSTLLLRAPKTAAAPTRIDVLFKPVSWMSVPSKLGGLEITELPAARAAEVGADVTQLTRGKRLFELRTRDGAGLVIAGTFAWHEDDGDYDDPPAQFPVFVPRWNRDE